MRLTFNHELWLSFSEVSVLLVTMGVGFLVLGHGLPLPQDVEEVVGLGVLVAHHGPALALELGGRPTVTRGLDSQPHWVLDDGLRQDPSLSVFEMLL